MTVEDGVLNEIHITEHQRGNQKKDNLEKLATQCTQDEEKHIQITQIRYAPSYKQLQVKDEPNNDFIWTSQLTSQHETQKVTTHNRITQKTNAAEHSIAE